MVSSVVASVMSVGKHTTATVNDIELEEGDTLWRYAGLRTYNCKLGGQDPDRVLQEVAEQLAENYPDAVNGAPAHIVKANLKGTPGIYDDSGLINYHAMEVMNINTHGDHVEVSIKDWKEEKRYSFQSNHDPDTEGSYYTFEPLSALETHLGVTILPVDDSDDE